MSTMNEETSPVEEVAAPEEIVEKRVVPEEGFTLEKGKKRVGEAIGEVKQAGKEISTRPLLNAVGDYFDRGINALIGLAQGMKGEENKKDQE